MNPFPTVKHRLVVSKEQRQPSPAQVLALLTLCTGGDDSFLITHLAGRPHLIQQGLQVLLPTIPHDAMPACGLQQQRDGSLICRLTYGGPHI